MVTTGPAGTADLPELTDRRARTPSRSLLWMDAARAACRRMLGPAAATLRGGITALRGMPNRYWLILIGYSLVVRCVLMPPLGGMFRSAVRDAGLDALSDRNVGRFLGHPAAVGLLAVITALVALVTITWCAATIVIADRQLSSARRSTRAVLRRIGSAVRGARRPESALLVLQLVVVVPLAGIGVFAPVTDALGLPPFIEREFMKTTSGTWLWCVVSAILVYVVLRTALMVPFVVVGAMRPVRGLVASLQATRRGGARFGLVLAVAGAGATATHRAVVELLGTGVDALVAAGLDPGVLESAAALVISLFWAATAQGCAFLLVCKVKATVVSGDLASRSRSDERGDAPVHGRRRRAALIAVVGTVLIPLGACSPGMAPAYAATGVPSARAAIVIAHRGFDSGGPENTLAGLNAAAVFHPDRVEVDVQQTRDGGFVASHDANLWMLAGVDRNVYDMTTAEATSTVVSMKGHSDRIPTMVSYVERARQLELPLLIELKITGHERPHVVASMLRQLEHIGGIAGNTFHSLDPAVVEEIVRLRPDARVGLTVGMLSGALPQTDGLFYVVEQASVTPAMIRGVHDRGKRIYAWTVNDPLSMRLLIREGIDGIVTDDPSAAERERRQVDGGTAYRPGDARLHLLR